MLAFKASTVEACGICGGKLFHVKLVLRKQTVFKYIDVGLVWLEAQGWVRESYNFGWRYEWDGTATTPFIIFWSIISLVRFTNLDNIRTLSRCWCYDICRDSIWLPCLGQIQSSVLLWIPHTGAVLKDWPNKCLVCICFIGVCRVRTFLFKN